MTPDTLISRIEVFAQSRGIQPATVTSRAVNNSRLYARLKKGGSCTLKVAALLEEFIAKQEQGTHVPKDGDNLCSRKGNLTNE